MLIPNFPPSATTNQAVLYALAEGTGGFVIVNTNDLIGGLEKIGREQNEYYVLGYSPGDSPEGSCHTLRVKVDRGGTVVRARSGYCNIRPVDFLAGNAVEKDLENRVAGSATGNVKASMQAPFFYTSPNIARVDMAMEIPADAINFEKAKKKFHSEVNILGIAYRPDGTVGARFSDTVKLDLDNKKELEAFKEQPLYYENQFEAAPGKYNLKVAFSAGGESFGKLETPLAWTPNCSRAGNRWWFKGDRSLPRERTGSRRPTRPSFTRRFTNRFFSLSIPRWLAFSFACWIARPAKPSRTPA